MTASAQVLALALALVACSRPSPTDESVKQVATSSLSVARPSPPPPTPSDAPSPSSSSSSPPGAPPAPAGDEALEDPAGSTRLYRGTMGPTTKIDGIKVDVEVGSDLLRVLELHDPSPQARDRGTFAPRGSRSCGSASAQGGPGTTPWSLGARREAPPGPPERFL